MWKKIGLMIIVICCFNLFFPDKIKANLIKQQTTQKSKELNEVDSQVSLKLKQIIANEIELFECKKWVILAGRKTNQDNIPLLKKIAELYSNHPVHYAVTLDALRALLRLGESKEYFLRNLQNYQQNKKLGYYSAIILAYDPNPSLINLLDKIERTTRDTGNKDVIRLIGVRNQANYTLGLQEELSKLSNISKKTEYLLGYLRFGAGESLNVESTDIITRPSYVWVRNRMYELSEKYPDEVAKTIFETDVRKRFEKDLALLGDKTYGQKEYRKYVSNFICLKAKKALYDLVNQARAQEMKKQ